jgi:NADP-dependent 3-hydroxy acid dehydrogenase YdfG
VHVRVDRVEPSGWRTGAAVAAKRSPSVDVTDFDQVKWLVDTAVHTYGRIDVMLNNAGLMPHSPLERLRIDGGNRTIDVKIKGVLYGIAAALPHMKQRLAGRRS